MTKIYKKVRRLIFSFIALQVIVIVMVCAFMNFAKAETIDNITKEVQTFDDWTVVCNKDVMMEEVRCKVAAKFYNNTASVFVQPENKVANHIVFIIPNALPTSIVKVKVGGNEVIESYEVEEDNFAVIPMRESFKKKILEQMKADSTYLYIRFYIRDNNAIDGKREVTERVSLEKFSEVISYYYSRVEENKSVK